MSSYICFMSSVKHYFPFFQTKLYNHLNPEDYSGPHTNTNDNDSNVLEVKSSCKFSEVIKNHIIDNNTEVNTIIYLMIYSNYQRCSAEYFTAEFIGIKPYKQNKNKYIVYKSYMDTDSMEEKLDEIAVIIDIQAQTLTIKEETHLSFFPVEQDISYINDFLDNLPQEWRSFKIIN